MNTTGLPFSEIRKLKDATEDGEPKKKTREEWKKAKELEEARKAGSVPAAVDELGHDINPHIPQYISAAPWYYGSTGPTLTHQRPQPEKEESFNTLNEHYVRGLRGKQSKKFRKGACENCGAMGHKKKECFERPRKVGAKYSSTNITADDVSLPNLNLDYDGKRDRWNGFNASEYEDVVEEFKKVEDYKRQLKGKKLQEENNQEVSEESAPDDDEDDDEKYADHIDMPGTKVDSKQRITVRNLRIREDTAKYLRNLNPNSAYYDPKTRSMRDNPYKNTGKTSEQVDYAGENFIKFSGDTVEQAKAQLFAWSAYEKGVDVSLQAEPTKLEILSKEYVKNKVEFEVKVSNDLLDKYGGKEHINAHPKELLMAQSENYVEYSRRGTVIKGVEKHVVRSIYVEDIYPNNHVSVWGSYWTDGVWGYKCCHSFVKNSYCTGESGKTSSSVSEIVLPSSSKNNQSSDDEEEPQKTLLEIHEEKMKKKKRKNKNKKRRKDVSSSSSSSSSSDSSSSSEDEASRIEKRKNKLREALVRAKEEEEEGIAMQKMDDRNRKYNSMYNNKKMTEEEIEAYEIRRQRPEDPMASFMK